MSVYFIPILLIITFVYAAIKKVPLYDSFAEGIKDSLKLVVSIFPYICAMFICLELFKISGLSTICSKAFAPIFRWLGLPPELSELIIMRPLSGNGSIAMLKQIFDTYGADSYIARSAAVIVGSSETVFYITAVYFSTSGIKRLRYAVPVSIFACLVGAVCACLLCKIM